MFQNMGIIVEKYCPLLNRINPAAVLSDAFYCLSVYDNPARYTRDMWTLAIMSVICIAIAFSLSWKSKYRAGTERDNYEMAFRHHSYF